MHKKRRAPQLAAGSESKIPPLTSDHETCSAVTGLEWVLVAMVLLAGIGLRLQALNLASVEHFDEGVYASNIWFDEQSGYQYPLRHLYAPPLFPALIESTFAISGRVTGRLAMLPSLAAACATLLATWWVCRSWFGPPAAIAGLCLAASSEVHTLFSRAALTDVLLLFFVVCAMWLFERAARREEWRGFILAGAVTGVAWWTKYNGWLPLLIVLVALGVQLAWTRGARVKAILHLREWFIAVATAIVIWAPYLYSLQPTGGYAQVAANHRQYIVGFGGWMGSFTRQLANIQEVDSTAAVLGWGTALLLAWVVHRGWSVDEQRPRLKARSLEWARMVMWCSLAAASAWSIGSGVLCLLVPALGAVAGVVRTVRSAQRPSRTVADAYLCAWFGLLFLMTPLYTPYLRLVLPLLGAAWLASARTIAGLVEQLVTPGHRSDASSRMAGSRLWLIGSLALLGISGWIAAAGGRSLPFARADDRRGLERIAMHIDGVLRGARQSSDADELDVVYVYGEPALLFHLRASGQPFAVPANTVQVQPVTLPGRSVRTYFAYGLHALNDPAFREEFAKAQSRFELLQRWEYRPSTLVLLDHYDPRVSALRQRISEVRLYRVR